MKSTDKLLPLYILLGLFALYLILKWTCRLLFGLLDYAILIGLAMAVVWYIRLPKHKKYLFYRRIKSSIRHIGQKLGLD